MNKKAEISTTVLISVVILIISAVIIFYFLYGADLATLTDEQICYNSVVARSSVLTSLDLIPLNCKTTYYCITKDGSCEIMNVPKIIKVQTSDDVYKAIAEKMANCWSMFGAGKINYVGSELEHNIYCSNCYQIGFDDSLNMFPNNEIDKKELYRYLSMKKVSGKEITYLEYLVGIPNAQAIEDGLNSVDSNYGKISIGKQYYVVMGTITDISKLETAGLGVAGFVTGTLLVSVSSVITGGAAIPFWVLVLGAGVGGGTGYLAATISQGESGQKFLTPTLIEANSEDYAKLNCSSIVTLA
jgi:hypothetical protein